MKLVHMILISIFLENSDLCEHRIIASPTAKFDSLGYSKNSLITPWSGIIPAFPQLAPRFDRSTSPAF